MKMIVKERDIAAYTAALRREERAEGTIEQYCRTLRAFSAWLCDKEVTQELLNAYKAHLSGRDYAPVTINAMLAALNGFFRFEHWPLRAKFLKVQRRLFRDAERELTRPEYQRLLGAAEKLGRGRLALLMETICATGIRVSEVCYIKGRNSVISQRIPQRHSDEKPSEWRCFLSADLDCFSCCAVTEKEFQRQNLLNCID